MNLYLACFDIQDDRARRYIAHELERYGVHVQKSVFELAVSQDKELATLKQRLQQWVEDGDDIRFYSVCKSCKKRSHALDGARIALLPETVIL